MKTLKILFIMSFAIIAGYLLYAQTTHFKTTNRTEEKLIDLVDQYDSLFFYSVFSLDDYRPYAIIQIDKLSREYDNKWMSPQEITSSLTALEKDTVIQKLAEKINIVADTKSKDEMIDKIRYCCMANKQVYFLKENFGFSEEQILTAMSNTRINKNVMEQESGDSGEPIIETNKEKQFIKSLNILCSLKFNSQMQYYSEIYYQLAVYGKE